MNTCVALQDDLYSLFFVNNNWYLLLRLHQILCDRLYSIYQQSQKVAEEEALCRKDRKDSTAVALRLKAPSKCAGNMGIIPLQ